MTTASAYRWRNRSIAIAVTSRLSTTFPGETTTLANRIRERQIARHGTAGGPGASRSQEAVPYWRHEPPRYFVDTKPGKGASEERADFNDAFGRLSSLPDGCNVADIALPSLAGAWPLTDAAPKPRLEATALRRRRAALISNRYAAGDIRMPWYVDTVLAIVVVCALVDGYQRGQPAGINRSRGPKVCSCVMPHLARCPLDCRMGLSSFRIFFFDPPANIVASGGRARSAWAFAAKAREAADYCSRAASAL